MSFPLDGLPPKMLPLKWLGNHRISTQRRKDAKAQRIQASDLASLRLGISALTPINDTRIGKLLELFKNRFDLKTIYA
jgi:hypothetical protein